MSSGRSETHPASGDVLRLALVFRFDPEARKAEYVTYDNVALSVEDMDELQK